MAGAFTLFFFFLTGEDRSILIKTEQVQKCALGVAPTGQTLTANTTKKKKL